MFVVLVATLICKNDKVLLVTEKKEGIAGKLNFPAGRLEVGETLTQGACREVFEETGLEVDITHLIDVQYFSHNEKSCIAFVFKGDIKDETSQESELKFDFYDIDFIKEHTDLLRNPNLILSALQNAKNGSKEALKVLK